jgi:hypothetical protein
MESDPVGKQMFLSLVELFKPHLAAVKTPKIEKWARSPYDKDEKKVLLQFVFQLPLYLIAKAMGQDGKHLQGVRTLFSEVLKAAFGLPRLSKKQFAANMERWLQEATATFVRGWLGTLHRVESRWDSPSLEIEPLDDAMLPLTLGEYDVTDVIKAYGHEDLSREEIRAILRAVKASLPPGQDLPPQVFEIFRAERELFS